jgi:glycosyltransferase involved in cell wall biosynthesis
MSTAIAQASVVAVLSDYESSGVAALEAISAGRPVVGFAIAGIGELVAMGSVHGVAPGATSATIALALVASMSDLPHDAPTDTPTWDSCAAQLADVYRNALAVAPWTPAP